MWLIRSVLTYTCNSEERVCTSIVLQFLAVFVQNISVLKLWQRSPLMLSTITHSLHPVHVHCLPNHTWPTQFKYAYPVCSYSMHLARHTQASSWHEVQHASCWLLLCYSYQTDLMLYIRHQYSSMLCIKHQLLWLRAMRKQEPINTAQCCASGNIWLNIIVSCMNNYGSVLCIHGSWLFIRHQYVDQCCASCINMVPVSWSERGWFTSAIANSMAVLPVQYA